MIIALSGHNGFIGSHIKKAFKDDTFILLDRDDLYGEPELLAHKIKGARIVINFAGYPVSGRWTKRKKVKIFNSRINVTSNLVQAINMLEDPPEYFISSSAIGIYSQNETHTEIKNSFSEDFLAEVVKKWEDSADIENESVRVIKIRLGLVMGNEGGAMPRLFRLFRIGLGGVIGSGKQVYSFIHIDDVIGGIQFVLANKSSGVYNFTAPHPVTNREFTIAIAKKMKMPALIWVPEIILRFIMGEASLIVTGGQTVYPKRLLDEGYNFTFATIDEVIENLLKE
jgi:uncharacterized protein